MNHIIKLTALLLYVCSAGMASALPDSWNYDKTPGALFWKFLDKTGDKLTEAFGKSLDKTANMADKFLDKTGLHVIANRWKYTLSPDAVKKITDSDNIARIFARMGHYPDNNNLPVFNYQQVNGVKDFTYAGTAKSVNNKEAHKNLIRDRLIKCLEHNVSTKDSDRLTKLGDSWFSKDDDWKPQNFIVSYNTKDAPVHRKTLCEELNNSYLHDFAQMSQKEGIDPQHPVSKTPVYNKAYNGSFYKVGTLSNLESENAKQRILDGKYYATSYNHKPIVFVGDDLGKNQMPESFKKFKENNQI